MRENKLIKARIYTKNILVLIFIASFILSFLTSCKTKPVNNDSIKTTTATNGGLLGSEGDNLGAIGDIVTDYTGYLGYGYDVAKSAYFNSSDVGSSAEIINMEELAKDRFVHVASISDTTTSEFVGQTLKEYQEDISSQIDLDFEYGLFSKVKGEFSLSTDMTKQQLSNKAYVKSQVKIKKERQLINTAKITSEDLIEYLNAGVKKSLNTDLSDMDSDEKQKYYDKFFSKFGTHVLADIVLGGRLDLNYVYENTQKLTSQKIKAKVRGAYKSVSASIDVNGEVQSEKEAKEFVENSSFKGTRIGGSVVGDIRSFEKAQEGYTEWAESIDRSESLEIIDVGSSCANSLIPIWELVESTTKSKEIQKAYKTYIGKVGGLFQNLDDKLDEADTSMYVKNIYIGIGNTPALAASDIDAQVAINEGKSAVGKTIIESDLNKGTGGSYSYIGYTMTEEEEKAIRDIRIMTVVGKVDNAIINRYGKSFEISENGKQIKFNNVNYQKNINTNATNPAISWVFYSTDSSYGDPIIDIGAEIDGVYTFGSVGNQWMPVASLGNPKIKENCNKYTKGKPTYLWYKK